MTIPPNDPSDEELVTRMVDGDEGALGALYDRHSGAAFGIAYSITGNRDDAEEAVSDAFVQCWTQGDRFDPGRGSVAAWLHTIVRSRALDRGRRSGRHRRLEQRAGDLLGPPGEPSGATPATLAPVRPGADPEGEARRRQVGAAVRDALAELPAEQRRAIELAWLGGLSHSEVAAALETPLGTIKTRIRSGMGKLREALSAYGSEGQP